MEDVMALVSGALGDGMALATGALGGAKDLRVECHEWD